MANIWRDPIFDRTHADVVFALQQLTYWKQSHTHAADVKVDSDKVVLNHDGDVYVEDDAFILRNNGVVYVENETLLVELGTVYDLKGCLNLSDITRIEDNITYLATRLTQYRYSLNVSTKEWGKDSLPTEKDMIRICNNIRSIRSGYVTPDGAADVPNFLLSYEDINALEQNLYLLKEVFDAMVASFIKSSTYKSGATMRLPIRR